MSRLRYLLLQTRNSDDAMRDQEVRCFARVLDCDAGRHRRCRSAGSRTVAERAAPGRHGPAWAAAAITRPPASRVERPRPWLERALDVLREIHRLAKPTFASCWGFQAMARAMGGRCIHDLPNAELGTIELRLTEAGRADPLFGTAAAGLRGQAGHEDHVVELPADAVLLASSERVRNQAFQFAGKPIYCTQFHPELDRLGMLERVQAYPEYVERIAGVPYHEFTDRCRETPEANSLLRRFVQLMFGAD